MSLDQVLLLGSAILLVSMVAARIGERLRLPALLLFLGVGVAVGELGLKFPDVTLAQSLGFVALVLILAEGGLTTRWEEIRAALPVAVLLATVGVVVSIAAVAAFAHFVLGLDLGLSILLGAVTSPTDSAAVFSVLRKVPLPHRIRGVLEAESGFNDAPIVLLVVVATNLVLGQGGHDNPLVLVGMVAGELVGGVAVGFVLGWVGAWVMRRIALPASGLYPLGALGWVGLAYAAGSYAHLSGFAAVYVAAVVLGNGELPHRNATRSFAEGMGWVAQIGLFVMLGMLADTLRMSWTAAVWGVVLGAFLTFVARPLSVAVCASWFKIPWRSQAFISWAGLRGAVPIIMATVPLAHNAPDALYLFDMVFVLVVVFTVLQGPTLPAAARLFGVSTGADATDVEYEFAPLDNIKADMLQVHVADGSKLRGVTVQEVRLPRNSVISLIVRDDEPFTPAPTDVIRAGDDLLVVTSAADRVRVERRFDALSKHGRLARWREE